MARVIEAWQTAGEKQCQNMFIPLFDFSLIAIHSFWHCYFPQKIKPPGAFMRRAAKFG
jgi:hypothetical protein